MAGWDVDDVALGGPASAPTMRGPRRRPRPPKTIRTARAWAAIVALIAFAFGPYWMIRGIEHDHVVDRGAGVLSDPFVHCSSGSRHRTCTEDVHLLVSASGRTVTLADVKGLYATLESRPAHELSVDHVYYDTTNSEVNKVTYGATTYQVETTRQAFLVIGIVFVAVGAASLGLFVYLMTAGRRRKS